LPYLLYYVTKRRNWYSMRMRVIKRAVSLVVAITFLSQETGFAKNWDKSYLMPDGKEIMAELSRLVGTNPAVDWNAFRNMAGGLTGEERQRLEEFVRRNWDALPEAAREIFEGLLGGQMPAVNRLAGEAVPSDTERIEAVIAERAERGALYKENPHHTSRLIKEICEEAGVPRGDPLEKEVQRLLYTYRFFDVIKGVRIRIDRESKGITEVKKLMEIKIEALKALRSHIFSKEHRDIEARLQEHYRSYRNVFTVNARRIDEILGFHVDYYKDISGRRDTSIVVDWINNPSAEPPEGFIFYVGAGSVYTLVNSGGNCLQMTFYRSFRNSNYWMSFEQDESGQNKYAVIWESEEAANIPDTQPIQKFQLMQDGNILAQRWGGGETNKRPIQLIDRPSNSMCVRRFICENGSVPNGFNVLVRGDGYAEVTLCHFVDFGIVLSTYLKEFCGRTLWVTFEDDGRGNKYALLWDSEGDIKEGDRYGYLRKYYIVRSESILSNIAYDEGSEKRVATGRSPIVYTIKDDDRYSGRLYLEGEEIKRQELEDGTKVEFVLGYLTHEDPNVARNARMALCEWTTCEGGVRALIGCMAYSDVTPAGVVRNGEILSILESATNTRYWDFAVNALEGFSGYPFADISELAIALAERIKRGINPTDNDLDKMIFGITGIKFVSEEDRVPIMNLYRDLERRGVNTTTERMFKIYYKHRYFDYLRQVISRHTEMSGDDRKKAMCAELGASAVTSAVPEVGTNITIYWNGYEDFFREFTEEISELCGFEIDYDEDIFRNIVSVTTLPHRQALIDWICGRKKGEIPAGFYCPRYGYAMDILNLVNMRITLQDCIWRLEGESKAETGRFWVTFREENEGKDRIVSIWGDKESTETDSVPLLEFYLAKDDIPLANMMESRNIFRENIGQRLICWMK